MAKRALITGITGQDGSYLAELLLSKGYDVYGLVRRTSHFPAAPVDPRVHVIQGDLLDQSSLSYAVDRADPHEVYNLAAQSHVGTSFQQAVATAEINGVGVARLLEVLKGSYARFYQASTSEMFGGVSHFPQNEASPFHPRSPYGCAKLYAHWTTINYRESYNMFACCGILFNHESPRRGMDFVTRKITDGVARIACGLADSIMLGNLASRRDWGFAGDYVEAMWRMLQQDSAEEYVIASGRSHSIADFLHAAFSEIGISDWTPYVAQDAALFRPAEVHTLIGDATKAHTQLGWQPTLSFEQLVASMVQADRRRYTV